MKNIELRLSELEAAIKGKNEIPVLVAKENEDGTYTVAGKIYTRKQLEQLCGDRNVETLIIDNIPRNGEKEVQNDITIVV